MISDLKKKYEKISYKNFLDATKSIYDNRMRAFKTEPLVNKDTGEKFNKKEVFKRAYFYANNEEWPKGKAYNKISKKVINKLIEQHENWAIREENALTNSRIAITESTKDIATDLNEIYNDSKLSGTEKQILTNARIGQGEFRKNVIETWGFGEMCPVTKISIREMLIASHIRPWSKCRTKEERLDGINGILLCSHLDKLFDNYLISFLKNNGKYICQLNKNLNIAQLKKVGLEKDMYIDVTNINILKQKRLDIYLEEHLRIFFKKNEV